MPEPRPRGFTEGDIVGRAKNVLQLSTHDMQARTIALRETFSNQPPEMVERNMFDIIQNNGFKEELYKYGRRKIGQYPDEVRWTRKLYQFVTDELSFATAVLYMDPDDIVLPSNVSASFCRMFGSDNMSLPSGLITDKDGLIFGGYSSKAAPTQDVIYFSKSKNV